MGMYNLLLPCWWQQWEPFLLRAVPICSDINRMKVCGIGQLTPVAIDPDSVAPGLSPWAQVGTLRLLRLSWSMRVLGWRSLPLEELRIVWRWKSVWSAVSLCACITSFRWFWQYPESKVKLHLIQISAAVSRDLDLPEPPLGESSVGQRWAGRSS